MTLKCVFLYVLYVHKWHKWVLHIIKVVLRQHNDITRSYYRSPDGLFQYDAD